MIYQVLFVIIMLWAYTFYGLITPRAYNQAVDICEKHQGLRHIAATYLNTDKVVCNDGYHLNLELELYPKSQ